MKYIISLLILVVFGCEKESIDNEPRFEVNYIGKGVTQFISKVDNSTYYEWNFGDGTRSLEKNPDHTYKKNGKYSVTLVTGTRNKYTSKPYILTVSDIPTTGSVVFWNSSNSGVIEIYIDDKYSGLLTKYMTGNVGPACSTEGFVTITKPEGAYSFEAIREVPYKEWGGVFQIKNGVCGSIKLNE